MTKPLGPRWRRVCGGASAEEGRATPPGGLGMGAPGQDEGGRGRSATLSRLARQLPAAAPAAPAAPFPEVQLPPGWAEQVDPFSAGFPSV